MDMQGHFGVLITDGNADFYSKCLLPSRGLKTAKKKKKTHKTLLSIETIAWSRPRIYKR